MGVRVCAEDRTGYAYSDEVTFDRMRLAAEAARAIADSRNRRSPGCRASGTPRQAAFTVRTRQHAA